MGGLLLVLFLTMILAELRASLRPHILRGMLPPLEPPPEGTLRLIATQPMRKHLLHLLWVIILHTTLLSVALAFPIEVLRLTSAMCAHAPFHNPTILDYLLRPSGVCALVGPNVWPLRLQLDGPLIEVQLPLDLLLFHVVIPIFLERLALRSWFKGGLEIWLRFSCTVLGLHRRLLPAQDRPGASAVPPTPPAPTTATVPASPDTDTRRAANRRTQAEVVAAVHERAMAVSIAAQAAADNAAAAAAEEVDLMKWEWTGLTDANALVLHLRIGVLLLLSAAAFASASATMLLLPLLVGRYVFELAGLRMHHDLYGGLVGAVVMCGMIHALSNIWHSSVHQLRAIARLDLQAAPLWRQGANGLRITLRVILLLVVACVWFLFVPLLFGWLFELVVIFPLRVPLHETAILSHTQDWAIGLVFLKIWLRCVLAGAQGANAPLKRELERIQERRDWFSRLRFDVWLKLTMPLLGDLLDPICWPHVFSNLVVPALGGGPLMCSAFARFGPVLVILLKAGAHASAEVHARIKKFHDLVHNEKYVIGRRLINYQPPTLEKNN